MVKVVLASGNVGKIEEINELFGALNIVAAPQSEYAVPEADEVGLTFVENAIIKARNACQHSGLPAIADDSGLEVDYLNGEPGIYSARYAGKNKDSQANNQKLLADLLDVPEQHRTARFRCVMVFMRHAKDPSPVICEGTWDGAIALHASGIQGFGYDPIFYVPTAGCSAAELMPQEKHALSHRGQAMKKLIHFFEQNFHDV